MGARGRFFARSFDVDMPNLVNCLKEGAKHKGAAVTEVLVNCVIFNDGAHKWLSSKEVRADKTITLEHGKRMIFGKDLNRGLVLDGIKLKAVTIGEDGYTMDDILIHDAHEQDPTLHTMLAMMDGETLPVAMGVIRDVEAPTYDEAVHAQIEEQQAKNPTRTLRELFMKSDVWEVK